jgi:hypothetical protein
MSVAGQDFIEDPEVIRDAPGDALVGSGRQYQPGAGGAFGLQKVEQVPVCRAGLPDSG